MKSRQRLILFFITLSSALCAQQQLTDFRYERETLRVTYQFDSLSPSEIIYHTSFNQAPAHYFNAITLEKTPLKINDSVSVYSVLFLNDGQGVFSDSIGNTYIGSLEKNRVNIIETINRQNHYAPNFQENFVHGADGSLVYYTGEKVYRVKEGRKELLFEVKNDFGEQGSIQADSLSWVLKIGNKLYVNGKLATSRASPDTYSSLIYKGQFFIKRNNSEIIKGILDDKNLIFQELLKTNQTVSFFVKEDSLFLSNNSFELLYFFNGVEFQPYLGKLEQVKRFPSFYKSHIGSMKLEISRTFTTFYTSLNDSLEGYIASNWIESNSINNQTVGIEVLAERETAKVKIIQFRFDGSVYYFFINKVDKGLKVYQPIGILNPTNILAFTATKRYDNGEVEIATIDLAKVKSSKLADINSFSSKSIIPMLNNGQSIYIGTENLLLKLSGKDILIHDFRNSRDSTVLTNTSRYQPSILVNDTLAVASDTLDIQFGISPFYNTSVHKWIGKSQRQTYALYSKKSNKVFELDFSKEPLAEFDDPFNYILYQNNNPFEDFIFLLNNKKLGVWDEGVYKDLINLRENERVEKVFSHEGSIYIGVQDYSENKVTLFSYRLEGSLQIVKEIPFEFNNKVSIKNKGSYVAFNSSKLFRFENERLLEVSKFWKVPLNNFWVSPDSQLYVEAFSENGKRYFYSSEGISRKMNEFDIGSLFLINEEIEVKGNDFSFIVGGQIINKRVYLKYNFQEGSISKLNLYPSNELFIWSAPKDTILFEGISNTGEKYFYAISKDGVFQLNETPINSYYAQYKNGELFVYGNKKGEDPQLFLMSLADAKQIEVTYTTLLDSELILSNFENLGATNASAFPNPFGDKLELEIPEHFEPKEISVFDMTGRIVFEMNNLSNTTNAELNHSISKAFRQVSSGTYLIKLISSEDVQAMKVIKN